MSAKRLNPLRIATEAVNAIEGTVQGIEMLRNMRPVDITAARDLLPDLHEATKSIRWLEKFLRKSREVDRNHLRGKCSVAIVKGIGP